MLEWHGAPLQNDRLISDIVPAIDEAYNDAETKVTTETLREYLARVTVLFNNVESIMKQQRRPLRKYLDELHAKMRKLPESYSQELYFRLLRCVLYVDRALRDEMQAVKLLYKVGQDPKRNYDRIVQEFLEDCTEEEYQEYKELIEMQERYHEG